MSVLSVEAISSPFLELRISFPVLLDSYPNPPHEPRIPSVQTPDHSYRSATIGSTRVARHAGTQHAISATSANAAAAAASDTGSYGRTENSKLLSTHVRPSDATSPTPSPANRSDIPCPIASPRTSAREAPSAIRSPISCWRCVTMYAVTP